MGGHRLEKVNKNHTNKVLVVDDTAFSGKAIVEAKQKLNKFNYQFIYMVAYLDGYAQHLVDLWLEDVRCTKDWNYVFYEWNIMNHAPQHMARFMFDIDGVFCIDPPSDHNAEEYENYIKDAIPLYIPKVPIGSIVTYRISKYRDITSDWLARQGIKYNNLIMFDANSREARDYSGISSAQYKANIYRNDSRALLFLESDDDQAREIFNIVNKPVYCVKTNKLYS